MLARRGFCAWLALAAAAPLALFAAQQTPPAAVRSTGLIARGTRWATPYFVQDTGLPGPMVVITGGVHGNEPAGSRAAGQIRHWAITRGKLVVVPRANELGLRAGSRFLPGVAKRDLNRNFPVAPDDRPKGELATALWQFFCEVKPTWLIDFHESVNYRKEDPKKVGNTVIHCPAPETTAQARRMLDAVNATISDDKRKFVLLRNPAKGSLARAAAQRLGAHAMILETTMPRQPLSLRTRHHRLMVHRLLGDLRMLQGGADVLYDGGGSGGRGPGRLDRLFRASPATQLERIGPDELLAGVLGQVDVLIVPGGSASKQARAMTPAGGAAIRKFVADGGGYVGICAGAYLAASNYSWSLKILDAQVIDRKHWKRGKATVQVELTPDWRRILGGPQGHVGIRYANGPLLAPAGRADIPDFETVAHFRSEVAKNGAPKGVMIGTPAMVAGRFGKGRVFVSSPHPESTPGLNPELVYRAVLWASGRDKPGERRPR